MALKIDATFGGILMAGLLLVIVGQLVPFIGAVVEDATPEMVVDVQSTVIYNATGYSTVGQVITIGTETYTISATGGEFKINNSVSAAQAISEIVTEINSNSTLVTAGTASATNGTILTSVLGSYGANYATTTNMSNGTFSAATMTGGISGSEWSELADISDTWGILITVLGGALSLSAIFYAISPIIGKKMLGGE